MDFAKLWKMDWFPQGPRWIESLAAFGSSWWFGMLPPGGSQELRDWAPLAFKGYREGPAEASSSLSSWKLKQLKEMPSLLQSIRAPTPHWPHCQSPSPHIPFLPALLALKCPQS